MHKKMNKNIITLPSDNSDKKEEVSNDTIPQETTISIRNVIESFVNKYNLNLSGRSLEGIYFNQFLKELEKKHIMNMNEIRSHHVIRTLQQLLDIWGDDLIFCFVGITKSLFNHFLEHNLISSENNPEKIIGKYFPYGTVILNEWEIFEDLPEFDYTQREDN